MPSNYYRRNNYDFVIDSSFSPFTLQEMLVPFSAYKDAYEEVDNAYAELTNKASTFKYLADNVDPNSKAAQIYNGYANDLKAQADDLTKNGLTMGNRRSLSALKRRYTGEIGRLEQAKTKMDAETKLRREMSAKDPSMLYASDNYGIDDFLDEGTPNLYGISGNDLYARGAAAGKAASSRKYSAGDEGSTLDGYYRKWVEKNGYSAESINAFRQNATSIPELQQAADAILTETGVYENLTGNNLARARQSVLNGIIDGAVYKEDVNLTRDLGVMSKAEQDASERAWVNTNIAKEKWDEEKKDLDIERRLRFAYDEDGNVVGWNPNITNIDNYGMTPDGKWKQKSSAQSPAEKKEAKDADAKGTALMKLGRDELKSKNGFDVAFNNDRHHYDWMGVLSKHGDKWYSGKAGEDNPGHNFPGAWGWASTSNVENVFGNFTYGPGDKAAMRVLSPSEIQSLRNDKEIASQIDNQLYLSKYYNNSILQSLMDQQGITQEEAIQLLNNNGYTYTNDVQIVAVKNEKPHSDRENYMIAVRTK